MIDPLKAPTPDPFPTPPDDLYFDRVRLHFDTVIITCDPDNHPSRRTIEKLGARFLNEAEVPPHDPHFKRGLSIKRRYDWVVP